MSSQLQISKLRNIGIMAHIDAGKTTTTERILFYSGALHKIGEVDDGNAFTDYMEQEKERGITITSASIAINWKDYQINIIDTPGHVDFTVEVQRSLRVLDGAIAVFSGVEGVESQSETVWRQADMYEVPRIAYINKMDRMGADFYKALDSMKSKLNVNVVPVQIPVGAEETFSGIIDLISLKYLVFDKESQGQEIIENDIPENLINQVNEYRTSLMDFVAELDENILEHYLETGEISDIQIKAGLKKAVIENKFVPIFCGSSLKNIGVQPLLDAIIEYLPSPVERKDFQGFDVKNHEKVITRKPSDDESFSALAFKVLTDPFVGKLVYLRIYSGILKLGSSVYNATSDKKEKILKILRMQANKREELSEAHSGDIVAISSLRFTKTGDTLSDIDQPIIYEKIYFSEPVINQSIEAKNLSDQEKIFDALNKFADEDPTFSYKNDAESGQLIISGVGELHLEIIVDRLKREFGLEVRVGRPQVSYREKISTNAIQEAVFDKDAGGKKQFGDIVIEVEPIEQGKISYFESKISKNKNNEELIKAIEEGAMQSLQIGLLGYPIIETKVKLIEIKNLENSSGLGVKIAASMAVKDAIRNAECKLFEPIVVIEINTPDEYMSDVIADLNSRKGRIDGISQRGNIQVIAAFAPLSEMFGYVTKLRSLSKGRATYSMKFSHYEQAN